MLVAHVEYCSFIVFLGGAHSSYNRELILTKLYICL